MTTPDLRSLTSGSADFSEVLDEAARVSASGAHAPSDGGEVKNPSILLTIDMDLPPPDAAPKPKGSKRRLAELKASVRRLSEMVPNELERIRRRRVQWLGDP